jgi:hypothetical protein
MYSVDALILFALRAHCGRDARGPSSSLVWFYSTLSSFCLLPTAHCPLTLYTRLLFS